MATMTKKQQVSILQEKISKKVDAQQSNVVKTLQEIETEGLGITDFIAPIGALNNKVSMDFHSNGKLKMRLGKDMYGINDHAVAQAGTKLGIPTKYIKDLAKGDKWSRDLAAEILNEHSLHTNRSRVLVRSVGNQIRGILSDKYRRLNTPEIYSQFLTAVYKNGGVVIDAHVDETRSFIETIIPTVMPIQTEKNGTVCVVFGARIGSSDYGDGALDVRTFMMQAVCLNGMVRNSIINQKHLGSRLPDDILLSEATYKKDTAAQASLVNDVVGQLMSKENLQKEAASIQKSAETEIDIDNEIKKLSNKGILKTEVGLIETVLKSGRENDGVQGEPTMWKLTQAMTAVARDHENGRRAREIQEIAGNLLVNVK